MKLSKFYPLIYGHAVITLKEGRTNIYHGPLHAIPNDFDGREVIDFEYTDTGFAFHLKAKHKKVKGG